MHFGRLSEFRRAVRRRASFVGCVATLLIVAGCGGDETAETKSTDGTVDVWTAEKSATGRLGRLLTPRTLDADVLTPILSPEARRIGEKLKQAAKLDPLAYLSVFRDGPEGSPPPYHVKLGISRDEYDALFRGSLLELQKKTRIRLTIRQREEGRVAVLGLPDVAELTIDPATQTLTTPYGSLARPTAIDPMPNQPLTGPMAGYAWRESGVGIGIDRFQIREIVVGQGAGGGDGWLIVRILDLNEERMLVDYFVRFPGPKE